MEEELRKIVKDRDYVESLLRKVSKRTTNPGQKKIWMAAVDRHFKYLNNKKLGSSTEDLSSSLQLENRFYSLLLANTGKARRKLPVGILEILPTEYPQQVDLCPSIDTVHSSLSSETVIISVHSYSGFDFSAEYMNIYKGKFSKLTVYDDLIVVVKRALSAIESSLSSKDADQYAQYIIRTAVWESILSSSVCEETVNKVFPNLLDPLVGIKNDFHHLHLYIGHRDEHLVFTVRDRMDLEFRGSSETEGTVVHPASFVYYREFQLSKREVEEMDQVMFKSSAWAKGTKPANAPPPPPPRPRKRPSNTDEPSDIRVFILLQHPPTELLEATAAGQTPEEDTVEPADSSLKLPKPNSSSFCSEILGWGFDASFSLGLGMDQALLQNLLRRQNTGSSTEAQVEAQQDFTGEAVHDPRPVPIDRIVSVERVKMIACSMRHTLLLTHMGSLFACGDNAEGALGVGDLETRSSFCLVDTSAVDRLVAEGGRVVQVAAGSTSIGSHSMALTAGGRLFSWGVAYAAGLGIAKPITAPSFVSISALSRPAEGVEGVEEPEDEEVEEKVVSVACGGGFTLCVTASGRVYSWGMWAHGRLGLGKIPIQEGPRSLRRRATKRAARYQLYPQIVPGVSDAVQVACGEAHALLLLKSGAVLSWGQNSCGQLGHGVTADGYLTDSFLPVVVPCFGDNIISDGMQHLHMKNHSEWYAEELENCATHPRAKLVACGAFHSICVDSSGNSWTWGARGSPCLGHNDAPLISDWNSRINSIFSIATESTKAMVPFELLDWCQSWASPRKLITLPRGADNEIVQVVAGDLSTAWLTKAGKLYICGTGPTVPALVPVSRLLEDEDDEEEEESQPESTPEQKVTDSLEKQRDQQNRLAAVVASPRSPSAFWLRELYGRKICYIAGGGSRIFSLVEEEAVVHALTGGLLTRLQPTVKVESEEQQLDNVPFSSSQSISESSLGSSNSLSSIFESRGKADCMILASGKVFLCHKALLAHRSPELRDMILLESPGLDDTFSTASSTVASPPVQLLLPELQRDGARALIYFLYTDVLPRWAVTDMSLLNSLARAGKNLRIPRLQLLSERFLRLIHVQPMDTGSADSMADRDVLGESPGLELPPPTLARDLGGMVGDPEFADVRFIAEGRAIAAHRFILENRCEYFRAMFRSGMTESFTASGARLGPIDVVVPDSFVGFLRLLLFLYTDSLPDGSDGALLEDFMAADRYGIPEMKQQCESMLVPGASNWLDLLRAAQLLDSQRLRQEVIMYLRSNFSVLQSLYEDFNLDDEEEEEGEGGGEKGLPGEKEHFSETHQESALIQFREEFPGILEEILEFRRVLFPSPPSQPLIEQTVKHQEAAAAESQRVPAFPIWALVVAAACLFLYQHVSRIVSLGWVVPAVNLGGLVFLFSYGMRFINTDK